MAHVPWETFINENLLRTGAVSGAAVLTPEGVCVSSYGDLDGVSEDNWIQFRCLFNSIRPKHLDPVFKNGFKLNLKGFQLNYRVYKKTLCSLYATSDGSSDGLIVCNLPYGVMICTYNKAQTAGRTINIVEQFCDQLRA